jgi:hypothetical protein
MKGFDEGIGMNKQTEVATAVAGALPPKNTENDIPGWHIPVKDQGFLQLDGDVIVVLMKFTVKNFEDVPKGVRLRKTGNRDDLHAKDAVELDLAHLAELSRVRNNRVDTGEMVLHVLSAQESIASLRAAGFPISDLSYSQHTVTRKYIIQIVFSRLVGKGDGVTFNRGMSEAEADAIRSLEAKAWETWIWDNRLAGKPVTINLVGGHTPRVTRNPTSSTKKLRIKDGEMRAYDE